MKRTQFNEAALRFLEYVRDRSFVHDAMQTSPNRLLCRRCRHHSLGGTSLTVKLNFVLSFLRGSDRVGEQFGLETAALRLIGNLKM